MELREYTSKREFTRTPEPKAGPGSSGKRLQFVVHKHAARAMHYDLRLELDGVLKSWAIPKGPSLDPSQKRLAVMVEDHPLAYEAFEGVIPEGNYGAGSVIIWDRGSYHHPLAGAEGPDEQPLREGLRKGDLKFVLEGEKLRGEFALVRMRKDGKTWLLMKKRDRDASDREVLADNRSVVSRQTLEQVLEAEGSRNFKQRKTNQIRIAETGESEDLKAAPSGSMPQSVVPMLATLAREPFDHQDWIFEVKWDGYRAIAEVRDGNILLYSRNGISFNRKYPLVVNGLGKLGFEAVLDGEIVVVDDAGLPDFEALQHYRETGSNRLLYYVFDMLYFQGHDLTSVPLLKRKELLKRVLPPIPGIRYSDHVKAEGVLFYQATREKGLEGILAKHGQSLYEQGKRSGEWLKIKFRLTQEGVIAGFTGPGGSRTSFGSLVLGAYENNKLIHIGNVGSGFSEKDLKEIRERLEPLIQSACPLAGEPDIHGAVTWVRPELVVEVSLTERTGENVMRQPVFLRLREDKTAGEVAREA